MATSKSAPTKASSAVPKPPPFNLKKVRQALERGERLSRQAWRESEAMSILDDRTLNLRFQ